MEQITLLIIKPDGVRRGLIGEVIRRIEAKGLKILNIRMVKLKRACAEKLYDIHRGKDFFKPLIEFMTSGPIVAMIIKGDEAVDVVRTLIGPTDGRKAPPGTIRGDFSLSVRENIVHAADSEERAKYEISLVFDPECDEGRLMYE